MNDDFMNIYIIHDGIISQFRMKKNLHLNDFVIMLQEGFTLQITRFTHIGKKRRNIPLTPKYCHKHIIDDLKFAENDLIEIEGTKRKTIVRRNDIDVIIYEPFINKQHNVKFYLGAMTASMLYNAVANNTGARDFVLMSSGKRIANNDDLIAKYKFVDGSIITIVPENW